MKKLNILAIVIALFSVALIGVGSVGAAPGIFIDSGQPLGSSTSDNVDLGDLDGDGDLVAFVVNGTSSGQPNKVWLNDGSGNFTDSGQSLTASATNPTRFG